MMSQQIATMMDQLKKTQCKVAFAESCTGGLLSSLWTQQIGVSEVYQGGLVAYANEVKIRVLGVSPDTLEQRGAVSEEVALEMAQGVCRVLASDWGLAITGIAGPNGGTIEKPVGLVCFAIVGPHLEKTWRKRFMGQRLEIQRQAVEEINGAAFKEILKH